jgi:hypothetical protein
MNDIVCAVLYTWPSTQLATNCSARPRNRMLRCGVGAQDSVEHRIMKYWIVGTTALLSLLALGPITP